jgi:polysaccharide export outer membrane protein
MLAIPLNRQATSDNKQSRFRTRFPTRSIPIIAVFAVLIGANQRCHGQNSPASANHDPADASAKQNIADNPQSQQTAVRFLMADKRLIVAQSTATQRPLTEFSKTIFSPPLAIANYESYIQEHSDIPCTDVRPANFPVTLPNATQIPATTIFKRLDPITAIDSSELANRPADEVGPRSITFAVTPRPAQFELLIKNSSNSIDGSAEAQRSDNATVQSELPASSIGKADLAPTSVRDRHVAMRDQALEAPKPQPGQTEPKVERMLDHSESIPMAATDGPSIPLTTSSFLPANPESYCFRYGVKCPPCGCNPGGPGWAASQPIPWEVFAQGEYVGPARLAHVPVYRLRVDDQLAFVYRLSGQVSGQPYRLNVRDRVLVQSLSAPEVVNREVIIEPDGTITLPLLGQVRAAGATLDELKKLLDDQFKGNIKDPRITVTPLEMNSNLQELRSSVDRRYGAGGQVSDARISPDGMVQLPAIGSVPAQGLTLEELEREIKARYAQIVEGLEVTPVLVARAPRFVYVVGEVRLPGRFTMEGPTTLMQAIALAGSWNVGAQLNEVVVFRRDENWQLMATKVNIRSSLLFKKPCPEGEIWLRDSDVVLIPKSPILCADDVINLVFTRGIYGVFPMSASLNFSKLTTL